MSKKEEEKKKDLQNIIQKTKDQVQRTPLNSVMLVFCSLKTLHLQMLLLLEIATPTKVINQTQTLFFFTL